MIVTMTVTMVEVRMMMLTGHCAETPYGMSTGGSCAPHGRPQANATTLRTGSSSLRRGDALVMAQPRAECLSKTSVDVHDDEGDENDDAQVQQVCCIRPKASEKKIDK